MNKPCPTCKKQDRTRYLIEGKRRILICGWCDNQHLNKKEGETK